MSATLDDKAVLQRLRSLMGLAYDAKKPLSEIGQQYKDECQQRFVDMADPDGVPWLNLSPAYVAVKPQNKDKILTLTGAMQKNLQLNVEAHRLTAGNAEPYAWLMQHGGKSDKGYVPARPYQGWSKTNRQYALGVFYREILQRAYGVDIEDIKYG